MLLDCGMECVVVEAVCLAHAAFERVALVCALMVALGYREEHLDTWRGALRL